MCSPTSETFHCFSPFFWRLFRHLMHCTTDTVGLLNILLAAISIRWESSNALLKVSVASPSKRRCVLSSLMPQTNQSRSMSSNIAPNSQCSESSHNSATKLATDWPDFWKWKLNLNLWTITECFDLWWVWTRATSSTKGISYCDLFSTFLLLDLFRLAITKGLNTYCLKTFQL